MIRRHVRVWCSILLLAVVGAAVGCRDYSESFAHFSDQLARQLVAELKPREEWKAEPNPVLNYAGGDDAYIQWLYAGDYEEAVVEEDGQVVGRIKLDIGGHGNQPGLGDHDRYAELVLEFSPSTTCSSGWKMQSASRKWWTFEDVVGWMANGESDETGLVESRLWTRIKPAMVEAGGCPIAGD